MKDRFEISFDISELVCCSIEPLEEIKHLLLVLKQNAFRVFDTEIINFELDVKIIEMLLNFQGKK